MGFYLESNGYEFMHKKIGGGGDLSFILLFMTNSVKRRVGT